MCGRKSIFDLERRSDILKDFSRLVVDMKKAIVYSNSMKKEDLYSFLDESIQDWPYRQATSSMNSYLNSLNIDKPGEEIVDTIYALELMYNLLKWAPVYNTKMNNPLSGLNWDCNVHSVCERFIENIEFILEQNNMAVREGDEEDWTQYRIYKRMAEVDVTLESAPELAEILLSYLDVRNEGDINFKKSALKMIADYLEPKRKELKGSVYNGLCEDVFFAFNNCNIRHNNEKQINMQEPERIKMYDDTFKMSLLLVQAKDITDYRQKVKKIKCKI